MLVDAGADVNATDKEGKSVLIYGVEARRVEAVKCLVSLGADTTLMDNTNRTALDYANALGLTQLIEGLSTGGGQNTDSFGNTALHQSCSNGQSEAVKAMLAGKDVDINALNDQGRTPVFFSVMQDNLLITELLLEAGADVNIRDHQGNAPLHLAAENENEYITRKLLEHGARIDERNKDGETALIIASRVGNNYIVGVLLENGANFTYADMMEHTALYYAAENGYNDIAEKLIMAGAER